MTDPNSTINLDSAQYHDYSSFNTGFVTDVLQPGTYYLIVDGNNFGSEGAFTVNVSPFSSVCALSPAPNAPVTVAEVEPNNDSVNFTKPTFLGTVGNGNDLAGAGTLNYLNDRTDTWHFKASTTGGTYTISLDCFDNGNGIVTAPQFALYDSKHNYLMGSSGSGQPNQVVGFLPQGDYYVSVQLQSGYSSASMASGYHLIIQGSAPPTPTLTPTATSTPPYSAATTWTINGATFNDPTGIALDGSGNVYLADFGNNRILKFDPSGTYQTQFADPAAGNNFFPVGLAVNSAGTAVFAADEGFEQRVDAFYSNAGTYSFAWGSAIPSGVAGVAVDNSGYVYATGGVEIQSNYLFKFLPTGGSPINTWGPSGGPDQINIPEAVAVNSDATTVYEGDNGNYVNVYYFNGTSYTYQFQFTVPSGEGMGGMAVDGAGNIYTSVRYGGQIFKFDPSGNLLAELGDGTVYGGGVAVDSSGNIYETTGIGNGITSNIVLKYNYLP